jgi:TetR/AcrR family transcriptional regulator, mexJK operon transcriptional repressor
MDGMTRTQARAEPPEAQQPQPPGTTGGADRTADPEAQAADDPAQGETRGYPSKRRAIMDAAAQVFLRDGYTRASVDAIAAAAGVSKQTIYNHFGDKERLLTAVTSAIQDEVIGRQEELLAAAFPDLERLREPGRLRQELLDLTFEWIRLVQGERISALRTLVYAEAAHHPQVLERWHANGPRRVLSKLNRLLVRLGDAGLLELPPELTADPERLAHQLTGAARIELQVSKFMPLPHDVIEDPGAWELVGNGVDFFLRAYTPRGGG